MHLFQAMSPGLGDDAARQRKLAQCAAQSAIDGADMATPGDERKRGRPVAALGRDREVVAPRKLEREREALQRGSAHRHGDDAVKIGIAVENAGGVIEHERVDRGQRPRRPDCGDERGRKQRIAEPAQCHHQDARVRRQCERRHGDGPTSLRDEGGGLRSAKPPNTPTANT